MNMSTAPWFWNHGLMISLPMSMLPTYYLSGKVITETIFSVKEKSYKIIHIGTLIMSMKVFHPLTREFILIKKMVSLNKVDPGRWKWNLKFQDYSKITKSIQMCFKGLIRKHFSIQVRKNTIWKKNKKKWKWCYK